MDCAQARTFIECDVDDELDPVTSAGVEEHARHCAACQRAVARLVSLRSLIKEGAPYLRAPDRFAQEVRARIDREHRPPHLARSGWQWQWLRPFALVAATAVVTWIPASLLMQPSRNDLLAEEIIASHARSTLTGHVADIESAERHTVKPWLSSKLDFSPPVRDLTSAGFPLAGARLDYVDRRPVAALVYARRKHVIDLFVWPHSGAPNLAPMQALSRQGYNVLHWNDGSMRFWAISDLNSDELKLFAEMFANAK